jgi:hypothetical protein
MKENIKIPEFVIDHCNKFKLCNGCKINCVAPVSDRDFSKWVYSIIERIKNYDLF